MERVIIKAKEREKAVRDLVDLAGLVADKLAQVIPPGDYSVQVGGREYAIYNYVSQHDREPFLTVSAADDSWSGEAIITGQYSPGSTFNLHGDFHQPMRVAGWEEYLSFARNLPAILRAFAEREEEIAERAREALKGLKGYLEEVGT